mmetsp:Transcript_17181/g.31106  ORF Transcript_17181/g.31106 Transcript_17181/m.31106 type:complete len:268 (+) Transcript_17181:425-1228(+)
MADKTTKTFQMRFYPGAPEENPVEIQGSPLLRRKPSIIQFYPGSHLLEYHEDDEVLEPMERDERDPSFPKLVRRTSMLYPPYKFLSLWLLPPQPERDRLAEQIAHLSKTYNGSAPFVPHVTVLGCVPCESVKHGKHLGRRLEKRLTGTGGIPCRFRDEIVSMYDDSTGKLIWSQSCLSIMARSEEFMNLLERSREATGMANGAEWMFPGPLREPHMSHYYGSESPPPVSQVQRPPDFVAHEVALFVTSPGSVAGVKEWVQRTLIKLC